MVELSTEVRQASAALFRAQKVCLVINHFSAHKVLGNERRGSGE